MRTIIEKSSILARSISNNVSLMMSPKEDGRYDVTLSAASMHIKVVF